MFQILGIWVATLELKLMPNYCILHLLLLQHHGTIYTELLAALEAFPKALTQSNEWLIFLWSRLDIFLLFFPLNSQQSVLLV